MRNRGLTLEFNNWEPDAIVLELAEYIKKGFHIATMSSNYGYRDIKVEVTLVEYSKLV